MKTVLDKIKYWFKPDPKLRGLSVTSDGTLKMDIEEYWKREDFQQSLREMRAVIHSETAEKNVKKSS